MAACPPLACVLLIASALSTIAAPLAAADSDWKVFKPEGGGFICEMPGVPKASTQKVTTAAGQIDVVSYTLDLPTGVFVVGSTPNPPNAPKATAAQRLDGSRDGAVKNTGGQLLQEKPIELDKHPGRELLIKHPQGAYIHQRVFLVNDRILQAVAVSPSKEVTADVARFFKSVKLVKE